MDSIARQLVRAATSPSANYSEARDAVSHREFVHKLHICLKELRETDTWLKYAAELGTDAPALAPLQTECSELIAIVVASIKRAKGI